jgi:hypothetical protein
MHKNKASPQGWFFYFAATDLVGIGLKICNFTTIL